MIESTSENPSYQLHV